MSEKKQEKEQKDSGLRLVIPFFAVLTVLTVVSFILPLRPTRSQMEKRNLAEFPEFSVEALMSGDYFDDISTWFSDTFPGREEWLSLSRSISSLHGYSEIAIAGDLPVTMEVPEETVPPAVTTPDVPEPSGETENVTVPTEPQGWGGVDAGDGAEIEMGSNAVIQIGDSAFNAVGFSSIYSDEYAKTVTAFAEAMAEEGITVVSAPSPTAVGILIEPEFLDKLNCARQDEMIGYMHSRMGDSVVKVDTYAALVPHNDEYIYFRTDHHWTARGAYYSYAAICEALGYEVTPLEDFTEWDQGEFEGSLYWKAANPRRLKLDSLIAYVPQGDIEMLIYNNSSYGREGDLIQDMTEREINAKYSAFICSDNPLTEITNNSIPDGPSCVLIKDSFGNALAPFLAQTYHKVYVVDYRKYGQTTLQWFLKEHEVDQVIFAPYVIATQAIDGNRLFKNLCR